MCAGIFQDRRSRLPPGRRWLRCFAPSPASIASSSRFASRITEAERRHRDSSSKFLSFRMVAQTSGREGAVGLPVRFSRHVAHEGRSTARAEGALRRVLFEPRPAARRRNRAADTAARGATATVTPRQSCSRREAGHPGQPLVGIAPGAAFGHAKRWPPNRYAQLADMLSARAGALCVVLGPHRGSRCGTRCSRDQSCRSDRSDDADGRAFALPRAGRQRLGRAAPGGCARRFRHRNLRSDR